MIVFIIILLMGIGYYWLGRQTDTEEEDDSEVIGKTVTTQIKESVLSNLFRVF